MATTKDTALSVKKTKIRNALIAVPLDICEKIGAMFMTGDRGNTFIPLRLLCFALVYLSLDVFSCASVRPPALSTEWTRRLKGGLLPK